MRFRFVFLLVFITACTIYPTVASASAAIPFFGPIIPDSGNQAVCPAGWGMLIVVINNIIRFLLTLAIVFVAPLTIAWAGFLYVVNPANPSGIEKAKGILWNTVLGLVLALSGWLIVNAVMALLYHPTDSRLAGKAWFDLITSGGQDPCLSQAGTRPGDGLSQAGPPVQTGPITGVVPPGLSTSPGNACNPETVTTAASSAGYLVSQSTANLLACIARYESTCGTLNPPYNLNYSWGILNSAGRASSAAGAYQVLLSSNSDCYENSVCQSAAGVPSGEFLFCRGAFTTSGMPIDGPRLERCKKAAGNVSCSAAAAVCLLKRQPFADAYRANPNMATCQSTYGT